MSSFRNAVQRRNHKERSQPAARQNLGLLEKKKDYVLRARDYHSKQNRLKAARNKAYFRNPNEFYFGMVNSKTKEGVHIVERNEKFSGDFLKLLKTQDINYVAHKRDVDRKKLEKLKESLHFLDVDDGKQENLDADFLPLEDEAGAKVNKKTAVPAAALPKHIVFVDNEEEVKSFEAATHFDTVPELVSRKFNRPRVSQLETDAGLRKPPNRELKAMAKSREALYREYAERLQREETLRKLELEMTLQKNLSGKGRRKKIGTDADGLAKYKWKADRKK